MTHPPDRDPLSWMLAAAILSGLFIFAIFICLALVQAVLA